MQKKLIALAVAGIAWAPLSAQAVDVTISGLFDLGVQISESETAGVETKKTTAGIHNGAATSAFKVTVTEDLGGGMKVTGYMETDPALGTNAGAAFANAPNWLQLSGGFGAITLGLMNNYALNASSASQPFGTGFASGYNGSFGRLDGVNAIGTAAFSGPGGNGVRDIRINNSIQYQLPNMGGFTGGIIHKFSNSDLPGTQDGIGQTQFGLSFASGPLTIAAAHSTLENEVVWTGTSDSLTHTMIGANYKLGAFTIYGGYTMSEGDNSADLDSTSMNAAVMFAFSPTLAAGINIVEVDDDTAANADRDLFGLGLNYTMSKRTMAYVRYQSGDKNSAVANTGDYSDIAVGLVHTF
jgi:predicted porin